jgi:hypothetical protein
MDLTSGIINIIIQSYDEKNEERKKELELCLKMNLDNPHIKTVYDLTDYPRTTFTSNSKYKVVPWSKWLTYQHAFEHANSIPGEYFAILNSDIAIDNTSRWNMAASIFLDNSYVLAQSRHEFDTASGKATMDPQFAQLLHAHTQDAWFFKSPILVSNCDFEIGLLGCDNAIAHRIHSSGYKIINNPTQFKILHIDTARGKTSSNFMAKHTEQPAKIVNKHPEEQGCYLLPNYDTVSKMTLDQLATALGFNPTERYEIMCEMMSRKIKIKNH